MRSDTESSQRTYGTAIEVTGVTDLTCILDGGHCAIMCAAIIPGSKRVILGMPFLHSMKARVNIFSRLLTLNGRTYVLQSRPTEWNALQRTPQVGVVEDDYLQSILHQYKDLWEGKPTGRTDVVEHQIKRTTSRPICCHPRKYSEEQRKIIDEEVDKMLTSGVTRLSKSP